LSPRWKGGTGTERHQAMGKIEYVLWRTAVFTRDDFTCQKCGKAEGNYIEAHHIKPWSLYPELRYAIDNGETLCKSCHKQTETWGAGVFRTVERVNG
jgi:5-methylcytosine-specific restriction endonuclease McrA